MEAWPEGRRFFAAGYVIGDSVAAGAVAENRWYIAAGSGWRLWAGGTDRAELDTPA